MLQRHYTGSHALMQSGVYVWLWESACFSPCACIRQCIYMCFCTCKTLTRRHFYPPMHMYFYMHRFRTHVFPWFHTIIVSFGVMLVNRLHCQTRPLHGPWQKKKKKMESQRRREKEVMRKLHKQRKLPWSQVLYLLVSNSASSMWQWASDYLITSDRWSRWQAKCKNR